MKKINAYCSWDCGVGEVSEQVDLYIDNFNIIESQNKKILFLCEPQSISRAPSGEVLNKFDCVLTFNDDILTRHPKARLFEFGTSWISDEFECDKEFSISFVCGNKHMTFGHLFRQELWKKQDYIQHKKFFLSRHGGPSGFDSPVLGESKDELFNSQFHIAIENAKLKYYFSEKLVDCFRTKTVPIYWGCPNIGDYFNLDGMFIVESPGEIIQVSQLLDENTYEKMLPAIEDNFKRSEKWKNLGPRLTQKIQELIDEKSSH
jgi:hypothetical protein